MNDPVFAWHVTMAVHEDRMSALRGRPATSARRAGGLARRSLELRQSLMRRRSSPRRPERRNWSLG